MDDKFWELVFRDYDIELFKNIKVCESCGQRISDPDDWERLEILRKVIDKRFAYREKRKRKNF